MGLFKKIILESLGVSDIVLELSKEIMSKVELDDLQQIVVDIPPIFNTNKHKIWVDFTPKGVTNQGSFYAQHDSLGYSKIVIININLDKIKLYQNKHNNKETLNFIRETLNHELTHFLQYQKNRNFRDNIGETKNYREYITVNLNSYLSKSNATVKWLNYYLYAILDIEIEAEIHKHYSQLKTLDLTSTDDYTFFIQNGILLKKFDSFIKHSKIEVLFDDTLETYLDYYKEHFYHGLNYKEIYKKLIKRIEDGIETYKRKVYRLASKIQNEKNTN